MKKPVTLQTVQSALLYLKIPTRVAGFACLAHVIYEQYVSYRQKRTLCELEAQLSDRIRIAVDAIHKRMLYALKCGYNANYLKELNGLLRADVITREPTLSEFVMHVVTYFITYYPTDESDFT